MTLYDVICAFECFWLHVIFDFFLIWILLHNAPPWTEMNWGCRARFSQASAEDIVGKAAQGCWTCFVLSNSCASEQSGHLRLKLFGNVWICLNTLEYICMYVFIYFWNFLFLFLICFSMFVIIYVRLLIFDWFW